MAPAMLGQGKSVGERSVSPLPWVMAISSLIFIPASTFTKWRALDPLPVERMPSSRFRPLVSMMLLPLGSGISGVQL